MIEALSKHGMFCDSCSLNADHDKLSIDALKIKLHRTFLIALLLEPVQPQMTRLYKRDASVWHRPY